VRGMKIWGERERIAGMGRGAEIKKQQTVGLVKIKIRSLQYHYMGEGEMKTKRGE